MNFAEWLKSSELHEAKKKLNEKNVPVYDKDGKIIGYVYSSTTSVGAAKVAKTRSAEFTSRNGKFGWIGVN